MPESVFAKYEPRGYPYRFRGRIVVDALAGGTPSDPKVAEGWIKSRGLKDLKDEMIAAEVTRIMEERGISADAAIEEVAENRHLVGFKRDPKRDGELYAEGRHLKACLKEAVNVAADVKKIDVRGYGLNKKKGVKSFLEEHAFVVENRLYLGVTEPTRVEQSFIHTFRGDGIQYSEIVDDAEFTFTVEADHPYDDDFWGLVWTTAQRQGVGAMRSQGFGTFTVTEWEPIGSGNGRTPRRKRS